ncbi:MAG: hypothetical protein K6E33_06060 [Lachnospiraceae bacterium]|nr:hypothetical protein [Lachnospiraceae bacterium]
MVKTIVGVSTKNDPKQAVQEATSRFGTPVLLIFTVEFKYFEETVRLLDEKFPGVPCIGTSGNTFSNGTEHNKHLVITSFESGVEAVAGVVEDIARAPMKSIKSVKDNVRKIGAGSENTVLIEFTTGYEEQVITTFQTVLEGTRIGLVGGTTFNYEDTDVSEVAVNGKIYQNACAYVLIKNLGGRIKTYRENIYGKGDHSTHIATKVNREKRELIELDGRPAADVYCAAANVNRSQVTESTFDHPFGRCVADEIFITSIKSCETNGTLGLFKQLNENDAVTIMDIGDVMDINDTTRQKIHSDISHASYVFSVDCVFRYLLMTGRHIFTDYMNGMKQIADNHMGYIAGGEQFRNQHTNQTMVCAVFE